jgi:CheY-like chemotaxis protein
MSEPRTYRVLVIEDKCDYVLLIEEAFAECGYLSDVQFAASNSQALNLLSTAPFDLILTNFGTDSEEARWFLHSVHAVAKRMPIVASGVLYTSARA